MQSKNKILQAAKLYVVLDSSVADFAKLFVILKKTVTAGTQIVQLRCKEGSAQEILAFIKKALTVTKGKALFIVNDRVDLVLASNADGVHLGQDDLTLSQARKILGPKRIIGVSCQTIRQARLAEKAGADYLGYGSVFKTKTKPQRTGLDLKIVAQVSQAVTLPVFFIGGITFYNVGLTLKHGAKRVAVTRAICEAIDVGKVTKKFLKDLGSNPELLRG